MARKLEKQVDRLARKCKAGLAAQLRAVMKRKKMLPGELATELRTSRAVIYRLLNPKETGVTLETLAKVASALGIEVTVSFKARR